MTSVHKTFQLRGYCTSQGYERIREALRLCRQLYNAALQERRDAWRMQQKSISLYDQMQQLTLVRKDLPEYGELDLRITRGSLLRVNRAYQAFFRRLRTGEKPGFPRFKPASRYHTIELAETREGMVKTTPQGWSAIRVKGLPTIRIKSLGRLPQEGLKTFASPSRDGDWPSASPTRWRWIHCRHRAAGSVSTWA